MLDIRPVLHINGILLLILSVGMAVPLAVDMAAGGPEWGAFFLSLLLAGFSGLALILSSRSDETRALQIREAFLATVTGWLLTGAFAAFPFVLSSLRLSPTDAYFEAMSGLTTTGATVLQGLDHMPRSILMWRAMLNWMGGAGVLVLATSVFPLLRIGGMQIFRMGTAEDRVVPRLSQLARIILSVYGVITLILSMLLTLAGMSAFDAVCHAMSSLSTGGFSTSDQSLGHFPVAAQWVCAGGMILGGMSFSLYPTPWRPHPWAIFRDGQTRWFLLTIATAALLLALWSWVIHDLPAGEATSLSLVSAVSVITTTGFYVTDYTTWGSFPQIAFLMMAFIGGCTGSTTGGIKIFRHEVLFAVAGVHIRRLLHPHGMFRIEFNGLHVSDEALRSVLGYMMLYFLCFAGLAIALTLVGLDATTGLSGAAAALGNLGTGLGPVIGHSGGYQALPQLAKWLLIFGMLMGRLELFPVLILFVRAFWRG